MLHVRTRWLGILAALMLVITGASAANAATSGSIAGTLIDSSGNPVAWTCVTAYVQQWEYAASACTDETGAYSLDGLTDGTEYRLQIGQTSSTPYQWYPGVRSYDLATAVTAPADLDISVAGGGNLSGTLLDVSGAPASSDTQIDIYDTTTYAYLATTYPGPDGAWAINLLPGDYKVQFSNYPAVMWYRQTFSYDAAEVLTVTEGATTNADAQLARQGTVEGHVTDAVTGAPISDVCVAIMDPIIVTDPGQAVGYGCTDNTGKYSAPVSAAGTFTAQFIDYGNGGYVGVYAGGTRNVASAATVDVPTTGIVTLNETMRIGGSITGKAVDARTGKPLADVNAGLVHGVFDPNHWENWSVWGTGGQPSDATGTYVINGVPAGDYTLMLTPAWASGYARQWYKGSATEKKATTVKVAGTATTTLKTSRFVPGGKVSGTVRDASGAPLANVYVTLDGSYNFRVGGCEGQVCALTDENGHYLITAPAGTYTPEAVDQGSDVLAPTFYGGASTPTTATKLVVKAAKSYTADFILRPGGHLNGTVVTADGQVPNPGDYLLGDIYATDGTYLGATDSYVDNAWSLHSTPLPPGTYVFRGIVGRADGTTSTFWFEGATTAQAATPITLGPQEEKTITVRLP